MTCIRFWMELESGPTVMGYNNEDQDRTVIILMTDLYNLISANVISG